MDKRQAAVLSSYKKGIFNKELKNRFLCEVMIDGETAVCYVPSSCHLGNFLNLQGKEVLLVPTRTPGARTGYALFAVPYKRSYIILNTSMANRAIERDIHGRRFAYLGKRRHALRECTIDGYKCDLYIKDTDTIIEIKSVISTDRAASFPTVYSERSMRQLEQLQKLLLSGRNVCFCIVALHPYNHEIRITDTRFADLLRQCIDLGMYCHGYTTRLDDKGCIRIEHEIPVLFDLSTTTQHA